MISLHPFTISSSEGILVSMETTTARAVALTAFAPAAWGTTYLVTERLLPPDRPLLSATRPDHQAKAATVLRKLVTYQIF